MVGSVICWNGLVTEGIQQLKSALTDVPTLLLDDDLASVLADARAAVDELEVFVPDPAVVVVLGPAGSGKSSVVNAIVGSHVAEVSPIRPTTTTVVAIGGSGASLVEGAKEFVLTEAVPAGLVIVDTPPWDTFAEAITPILSEAALAVVVVTPARYGDEQTAHAIEAAKAADEWRLVVNRLPQQDADRQQLLDAVHERLGVLPAASIVEGEEVALGGIVDDVERDTTAVARVSALSSRAGSASRNLAMALTERATEVGGLGAAIDTIPPLDFAELALEDAVTWEEARDGLVEATVRAIEDWEARVTERADSDLARRVKDAVPGPDPEALTAEIDGWRTDTSSRFRRRSTIWFRKKSGHQLIDRWSWITSVNPHEPQPRRFRRMMGDALDPTVRKARADLVSILGGSVAARPAVWHGMVDRAGSYRPGMLMAAADLVDPPPGVASTDD